MDLIVFASLELARVLSGGVGDDGAVRALPAVEISCPASDARARSTCAGAEYQHPAGELAMPSTYELHFQEGFTGQTVEVLVDDAVVASFEARTRMQISLAHIERMALAPAQVVTIRVGGSISGSITADKDKTFIKINLKDNKLILDAASSTPGYL